MRWRRSGRALVLAGSLAVSGCASAGMPDRGAIPSPAPSATTGEPTTLASDEQRAAALWQGTVAASWTAGASALEPGPAAPDEGVDPDSFITLATWARRAVTLMTFDIRTIEGDPRPFETFAETEGFALGLDRSDPRSGWILVTPLMDPASVRLLARPRGAGSWTTSVSTDLQGASSLVISWGGVVMYPVEHPLTHDEHVVVLEKEFTVTAQLTDGVPSGYLDLEVAVDPVGVDLCASFDAGGIVADHTSSVDLDAYDRPAEQLGRDIAAQDDALEKIIRRCEAAGIAAPPDA